MNKTKDIPKDTCEEGSRIRLDRNRLGLSQEELAHAVGVEQSMVSKVELGKVKSAKTIEKFRAVLSSWEL